MQTTYHITCKCGHDFPIPAQFLSTDEDERTALLKAMEGLLCPDCIRDTIDQVHALREHLLKTRAVSPDITEVGWKTLASDARRNILRENIIPPLPPRSPDISDEIMRYPPPPELLDVTDFRGEPNPPITSKEHTILAWIDRWNRYHPIGTEVLIIPLGSGTLPDLLGTKTTSPARMHHEWAVVDVAGHGMINLDRLIDMTSTNECIHYPDGT